MKKAVLMLLIAAVAVGAAPLSQGERNRALSHLHATRKAFLDSLDGLSEAQWNYKAAEDRWSIGQTTQHVAISEKALFQMASEKVMQAPATPEKATAEQRAKDAQVTAGVADRSNTAQAPEFLRPSESPPGRDELIAEFKASRERTLAYIRESSDEMRDHVVDNDAFGQLDAYQWILLLSAHTERHTKQILEVKEAAGFPKR